jgi:alkyldihydroxyacetonephosphate synthase
MSRRTTREPRLDRAVDSSATSRRIEPPVLPRSPDDSENPSAWGFRDSAFRVNAAGEVVFEGARYDLAGAPLPELLPWARRTIGVDFDARDTNPPRYPPAIPEALRAPGFESALARVLRGDQLTRDPEARLRRGHGHTQEDMYAIRYGAVARVPDLVALPENEEEVLGLVQLAAEYGCCVIPYGGGTNVTDALRCPENERRLIVACDLSRMDRIRWIDPENRSACIEAGAVGRRIHEQLASYGFTLGHEPDSVEFSTLGGWIATNASGMKKNRYGNIEELVLDLRAVTPAGVIARSQQAPRESIGIDPRRAFFGYEGNLGIVTSAVVKLFPLPELQKYGSLLFPDFASGLRFLYALERAGDKPASVRLVDNLQFQFAQALKPRSEGLAVLKSRLEKAYVLRLRGFDPGRMVACTLVFEGSRGEVAAQERAVNRLAKRFGGIAAGAGNGQRGYQLTFGIAYIRDFMMEHWILAESFETSVPWSRAQALCERVKQRLRDEHAKRGLPGKPFVTCRVTQLYATGVCIYFYFGIWYKGLAHPSDLYAELERCARDEVLRCGGSLSHHHGVGKLRERYLPEIHSRAGLDAIGAIKRALDPDNVFGVGNQGL